MREREIISLFYKTTVDQNIDVNQLDDCSLLPDDKTRVVTTDTMIEGTHFCLDWSSPEDLAIKLFQINLSDIVSSGAKPNWCLLTLGLTKEMSSDAQGSRFLERFSATFKRECWRHETYLIGGDTVRSPCLSLGLVLGGDVQRYISRSGNVEPGDHLYITGNVGLSLAGLHCLEGKLNLDEETQALAMEKHLQPQARVQWASALQSIEGVRAMMDVSDGLLSDAVQFARANGIDFEIDLEKIPIAEKLNEYWQPEDAILSGEELELLFIGKPGLSFPFPCVAIGQAKNIDSEEPGVRLMKGGQNVPFPLGRHEHF